MHVYNRMMRIIGEKIRGLEDYQEFLSFYLKSIDDERSGIIDNDINIGDIEECFTLINNVGNYDKELSIQFTEKYLEHAKDYYSKISDDITSHRSASTCINKIFGCKKKEFIYGLDQTPKKLKDNFDEMLSKTVVIPNVEIILNVLYIHLEN